MSETATKLRAAIVAVRKLHATTNLKFDMNTWGEHYGEDHKPEEHNFCKTAACLAGSIVLSKVFPFKAEWGENMELVIPNPHYEANPTSEYRNLDISSEVAKALGIEQSEANNLFLEDFGMSLEEKLEAMEELAQQYD